MMMTIMDFKSTKKVLDFQNLVHYIYICSGGHLQFLMNAKMITF